MHVTCTQGTILSMIALGALCGFIVVLGFFLMEVQQRHTLQAPRHEDTIFSVVISDRGLLEPFGERDMELPVCLHLPVFIFLS